MYIIFYHYSIYVCMYLHTIQNIIWLLRQGARGWGKCLFKFDGATIKFSMVSSVNGHGRVTFGRCIFGLLTLI